MFQTHLTICLIRARFGDIRFSDEAYRVLTLVGKIQRIDPEYKYGGVSIIRIIGQENDALLIIREEHGEQFVDLFSSHRF